MLRAKHLKPFIIDARGEGGAQTLWSSGAVFAVVDQGLFAGSNFVVNVALARWLGPHSYGAFTIAYSILLLAGTFHAELFTAPLLVFGASKGSREFRSYLAELLRAYVALAAGMSGLLASAGAICWFLRLPVLAAGLLGVAAVAPFVFLLWLTRSAFYARLQTHRAATGSGVYVLMLVAGLYGLLRTHFLTPLSALAVMGFASASVAAWLLWLLRPEWSQFVHRNRVDGTEAQGKWAGPAAVVDHVRYARWSLPASLAGWVGANLHYLVLSSTAGLDAVAAMRILDTALLPFYHYQMAVSNSLVPMLRMRLNQAGPHLVSFILRVLMTWAAQACLVYVFLAFFGTKLLSTLYGHAYVQHSSLLAWYAVILIPDAIVTVALSLFRTLVKTDLIFQYQLMFSSGLLVSYLVGARYGLPGIIVARIFMSVIMVPIELFFVNAVCRTTLFSRSDSSLGERRAVEELS